MHTYVKKMAIIVTGGAGFIGSCVVRTLNDLGESDIIVVDNISTSDKWLNMRNKKYREYINKKEFLQKLDTYDNVECIFHMGACSATTEKDFDYLYRNNFEYTKALWNYCVEKQIKFIYASSAATYGDGANGFDDREDINRLLPLNGYGYSKQLFDIWVQKQKDFPLQYVGLKFFNVYGPNEYFKGSMASMIYHGYNQIKEGGRIRLFKSGNPNYKDGGQLRDFVYVKDVCDVILHFYENSKYSGLYNVGTGKAQSFQELAEATFKALDLEPNIEFIDMPEKLQEKYQYYTEANIENLRSTGYKKEFCDLDKGAYDYVRNYLKNNYKVY